MKNIFINKLQCIYNSKYFNYYIYTGLFLICFFVMAGQNFRLYDGDDVNHINAVKKFGSAYNFMIQQYNEWNSRYFTSIVMAYIMDKNIWLWRILNSIVLFGLLYYIINIIKIIYKPLKIQFLILVLMVLSTYGLLSSGIHTQSVTWVTGSFNYLWPASALICYFYFLFNYIYNNRSVKLYEFIILIPIVMFATNIEQAGLVFVVMTVIWMIYYIIKNKTFDKYLLLLFIVGCISFYFVYSSPAQDIRYNASSSFRYPMLKTMSYFTQLIQGYPYTVLYGYFLNSFAYSITLCIFLYIIIKEEYKNKIYNIVIFIPVLYSLIYYIGRVNINLMNNSIFYNLGNFSQRYLKNNMNEPYISVIIGTIMLLIVIFYILKVKWSSITIKYLAYLLFLAGICSSLILCFSPTIYASGERIWFVPYGLLLIFIAMVFMELLKYINIKSKKFIIIFSLYFIVGIIDMFSKVYR